MNYALKMKMGEKCRVVSTRNIFAEINPGLTQDRDRETTIKNNLGKRGIGIKETGQLPVYSKHS